VHRARRSERQRSAWGMSCVRRDVGRRSPADARFDRIECADPAQASVAPGDAVASATSWNLRRSGSKTRRAWCPPCRPVLEAGVSVHTQDALEGGKMCWRSLRFATHGEQVDGSRVVSIEGWRRTRSCTVVRAKRRATSMCRQPSQRASNCKDLCRDGRRSAPADIAEDDRSACRSIRAQAALGSPGHPRSTVRGRQLARPCCRLGRRI
jgi:hypothetical protein